MTLRAPDLPFLPGYSYNQNLGKTKYHKHPALVNLGDNVRILTDAPADKQKGILHERWPSIYNKGEASELPSWISFDKQILTFDAYFQENLQELQVPFQVRKCKIYFFLEDGTIRVVEPKVPNSGIPQGTLINRHRIRLPPPKEHLFYDIIDFNIGKQIEIYGRFFQITNCDNFTRTFLNKLGITVPDPVAEPVDPYMIRRQKCELAEFAKKFTHHKDNFGQFLANDRKVLRFNGYWDDRFRDGYIHDLVLRYFLADDTIEIQEVFKDNSGVDGTSILCKRGKLLKSQQDLLPYSDFGTQKIRYVIDPAGSTSLQFYTQNDLTIGGVVNAYGKKIVLTNCDEFTKEYYASKYGMEDFAPIERPKETTLAEEVPVIKTKLPPYNGFGTFKDSVQNCITVEPKPVTLRDFKKFLKLDREGMDSRILRFQAIMLSKHHLDNARKFVVCYYLGDDTISVHELIDENVSGRPFLKRDTVMLPNQEIFSSEPPKYYEPHHMFIGATINLNGFLFLLTDADEYALRYMEQHPEEFPKANIKIILHKIKNKLRPIYKEFVAENLENEQPVIEYGILREKLNNVMDPGDWTEQEMIILARHFSGVGRSEKHSKYFIRRLVLTELKRYLWDDLIRFKEYVKQFDTNSTGFLPWKKVYTLVKACRLPLDNILIQQMLNELSKNENNEIDTTDLINFINKNYYPVPDVVPINVKNVQWWFSDSEQIPGKFVDWYAFNKALGLEEEFKYPTILKTSEDN